MPIPAPCRRLLVVASCWAWPVLATPAADGGPQTSSFLGELLAILVPLAVIIVALLLVLRLARRRYGLTGRDAPLSIVQILPLGPRERIVLIRAQSGRVFTVGVGAQSVSFITDLDPADLKSPEASVDAPVETTDSGHLHTAPRR